MDSAFFNREEELKFLQKKFKSGQPELLIFRGRRRIGKTFLLKEFCRRVNGLYLLATVSSVQDQLQSFSQSLSRYFGDTLLAMRPFSTWDEFFLYLQQHLSDRTAIIFDEYPYLLESQPGLGTILQKYWDEHYRTNNLVFMVLNGSALSMMEKETLEGKSPLYGRRTGQWLVASFDPIQNSHFFSNTSLIRCIEWYAITGGVPYYSQILSRYAAPLTAILHKVLTPGEALFEEVEFLLRGEFRNPRSYFPILKAIALGSRKFGEIASKTGYDRSNLTKYMAALESLKLLSREVPVTEKNPAKSKKGIYALSDYFMNFWFHYVFAHMAEIETGGSQQVMEQIIRPTFDSFVSQVCERIIIQLLVMDYFKLGLQFEHIGRHWDRNTEFDIFAYTTKGDTLIGEIKWTSSPVGESVLKHLVQKISHVRTLTKGKTQLLVISKSGFKPGTAKKFADFVLLDLKNYRVT